MLVPVIAFSSSSNQTFPFSPLSQDNTPQTLTPEELQDKFRVAPLCYLYDISTTVDLTLIKGLSRKQPCIVSLPNVQVLSLLDNAMEILNNGAHKVSIPYFQDISPLLKELPKDRIFVEFKEFQSITPILIYELSTLVSGFILHTENVTANGYELPRKFKEMIPKDFYCGITGDVETEDQISRLDGFGINVLCGNTLYNETLDLGLGLAAPLISDRTDGLFPTVVVDEQSICLGLVYSSKESLKQAVASKRGVYQSRKHGLWYKGEKSGSTQDLVRIDLDCDRDALRFTVKQNGSGFCHFNTWTCFGERNGVAQLLNILRSRFLNSPEGSYSSRLFKDEALLRAKILEEADELCDAKTKDHVAAEATDLLYFALVKCVSLGISFADIERNLDNRALKIKRRAGDAKPGKLEEQIERLSKKRKLDSDVQPQFNSSNSSRIQMQCFEKEQLSPETLNSLTKRPVIEASDIMSRIQPIRDAVRVKGDQALLEFTAKFDKVELKTPVITLPLKEPLNIPPETAAALDLAMENVTRFHSAQLGPPLEVQITEGVTCSRFHRAIERVGLYIPGGSAVLPSTAYMLGIPATVAGCKEIIFSTPPRKDGTICPEVLYVAAKLGVKKIVVSGGAQAIFAMAYGTESVPKVDKICGPGNQYVTAAKMMVQNDTEAMVSIDMPAGPSEVLVICDKTSNPKYVASDLLSQAEHGPDSQVVLIAVDLNKDQLQKIEDELHDQASKLPRVDIVRESISKSFILNVKTMEDALTFSNQYAPEHLILNFDDSEKYLQQVTNAGSVFIGPYSSESCGDYASGTNHTLPTYGFAKMYSGVNTSSFVKHITSQKVTSQGLKKIGPSVVTLARCEELEAHARAVQLRLDDLNKIN